MPAEPYSLSAETTQRASRPSRLWSPLGMPLLLALSYLMLLGAPLFSQRIAPLASAVAESTPLASWVSILCAAGLALGGASALIIVLVALVRDADRRPYVYAGPIVAAFSAIILIGLQPELPLPGVSVSQVAVFTLAVVVAGGSLLATGRRNAQRAGLALALLPVVTLLGLVWAATGKSDPGAALWAIAPSTRAFLCMLALSAFAIALVAASLGRAAIGEQAPRSASQSVASSVTPLLSRSKEVTSLLRQPTRYGLPSWALGLFGALALLVVYGVASFARSPGGVPALTTGLLHAHAATASMVPAPLPTSQPLTPPSVEPSSEPAASATLAAVAPAVAAVTRPVMEVDDPEDGETHASLAMTRGSHRRERHRDRHHRHGREHRRDRDEEADESPRQSRRERARADSGSERRTVAWGMPMPETTSSPRSAPSVSQARTSPAPVASKPTTSVERPAAPAKARGGESLDSLIDDVLGSIPNKK